MRIEDTAAGDDDRLLRLADQGNGVGQFVGIRPWPALRPDMFLEQADGIVEGFGLDILAKRQRHRTAVLRIGQHLHGALQGRDDLLRPGDPVEITRDRAERIVGGNRAIAEILDLLQHGVGSAVGKYVAGQE